MAFFSGFGLRPAIKTFDNGVKVFDRYLIDEQRARYANVNVHEPVEEQWILDLCKSITGSFRFWDVGAGIGYYSLLVASRFPNSVIEAFEPLGEHADAIERHMRLNNVPPSRIALHRTALGNQAGYSKFIRQGFGSAIACPEDVEISAAMGKVPTSRIDDILLDSVHVVDIVKVDVQGFELAVIEGARRTFDKIRNWIVGTHGNNTHAACHSALTDLGYTIKVSEPYVEGQPDGLIVASRS